ncbi:hypothetical protein AB0C69_10940 [Actinomadura sp. NPDC048032]|uniref:zinc finger domain-containing protein n=1 Tax=Actinomadura sp. NPDC048032 TaxID=3155747 RepID=UPI0033DE6E83
MALPDTEAYDRARDAYLATHPAPKPSWFHCPRCKAEPGTPCAGRVKAGGAHAPRQDLSNKAFNLRSVDAANHADNVLNEAEGIRRRLRTDRHTQYMRRVNARPPITEEN